MPQSPEVESEALHYERAWVSALLNFTLEMGKSCVIPTKTKAMPLLRPLKVLRGS